jgi:hypothetical protein
MENSLQSNMYCGGSGQATACIVDHCPWWTTPWTCFGVLPFRHILGGVVQLAAEIYADIYLPQVSKVMSLLIVDSLRGHLGQKATETFRKSRTRFIPYGFTTPMYQSIDHLSVVFANSTAIGLLKVRLPHIQNAETPGHLGMVAQW